MEISTDLRKVFDKLTDRDGCLVLNDNNFYKYASEELEDLVDDIGELSRQARGVRYVSTSSVKFNKSQNIYGSKTAVNFLYIEYKGLQVVGFAYVQRNKPTGCRSMVLGEEGDLIDFFIHPSFQGKDYGKILLNKILTKKYVPADLVIEEDFNSI